MRNMFKNFFKSKFYIDLQQYRPKLKFNKRQQFSEKKFIIYLFENFKYILYSYFLFLFVFYYLLCLSEINTFLFLFVFIIIGVVYLYIYFLYTKYKD